MLRTISLQLISVGFVAGGIMHFTHDVELAAITPLPYAYPIVWVTGVMEFFFALFLWIPRYRLLTGLWLSLFCLVVLPANIYMAINDLPMFGQHVEPVIRWLRIPVQFGLIAWILYAVEAYPVLARSGVRAFIQLPGSTPIYVVVSGRVTNPDKLAPYAEASGPLAQAAGLEFMAHSKPVLLEGKWPYEDGMVAVEKFTSKEELEKFWHSDAYREAKKLREGVVDIDFIIAVEEPG